MYCCKKSHFFSLLMTEPWNSSIFCSGALSSNEEKEEKKQLISDVLLMLKNEKVKRRRRRGSTVQDPKTTLMGLGRRSIERRSSRRMANSSPFKGLLCCATRLSKWNFYQKNGLCPYETSFVLTAKASRDYVKVWQITKASLSED